MAGETSTIHNEHNFDAVGLASGMYLLRNVPLSRYLTLASPRRTLLWYR